MGADSTNQIANPNEAFALEPELIAKRAKRYLSASPRPFLRWAGSKRRLLQQVVDILPSQVQTYREPFLGGASLFFLLDAPRAVLSDSNAQLIDTYAAVRDDADAVLKHLEALKPDRKLFYEVRKAKTEDRFKAAAEFIYLNKTCWNGLYRVNSDGQFNVPYGAPKSDNLIDPENLRTCAESLGRNEVILEPTCFQDSLRNVAHGDLVYLDPPYVTRHNNNGFVDYNQRIFSWDDQEETAALASFAHEQGAHVIVTNAMHQDVLDLYPGFEVRELSRHSTLASTPTFRSGVVEALLWAPAS